ncbi:Bacterial type II/III secretion system short domain protein [Pseudobythopirellula maris]|uniref:Bacterial type II/III secretion system short domain protein n=1 Tax=Pseudobythopirellula maris TaxID=2527991 RepID=A0A5C5ZUK3_9BACT|nr:secretin N-terminal domain-containing protein [Pseudobythopirellula maris]TWT90591.1 Bacterial type II/III secretion system short domain protein [Pseudobythopirellula maris]
MWQKLYHHSPTRFLPLAALVAALLAFSASARAQEPDLLGVLALALESETADELGLSQQQRDQLWEVADERELAGLSLAMSVRDLPRDEQLARLAPYRRESEEEALRLLTPTQREALEELRASQDNPAYSRGETPAYDEPLADERSDDRPQRGRSDDRRGAGDRPQREGADRRGPPRGPSRGPALDGKITFNFHNQPWRDVLEWFAERADLSLILDSSPPGAFNYRDTREYEIGEALDVINGVLQTKGYTLLRKDRMLLLVNLEDEIPPNLVTDVPLSQLGERGEYELVRVLFRVRGLDPETAAAELRQLVGPQGKVLVLAGAGMIQVTETAGRIRTIRGVIEAIDAGSAVDFDAADFEPSLRVYTAVGVDSETALKVLQTILAGNDQTRLAVDPATGNLVAFATADDHQTIRATLDEMRQETRRIDVIPLSGVDPQTAVLAINKMYSRPGESEPDPSAPLVDADLTTRTLLVRASPAQLEQIQTLLDKLGASRGSRGGIGLGGDGNVRILPLSPSAASGALEQIEGVWGTLRANPLRMVNPTKRIPSYTPSQATEPADERTAEPDADDPSAGEPGAGEPPARGASRRQTPPPKTDERRDRLTGGRSRVPARFVAEALGSDQSTPGDGPAPIFISPGGGGLIIASEDIEALDDFERLLASSTAGTLTSTRQYAVFYLKYASAPVAAQILANVFGASSSGGGGLMSDLAGAALGGSGGGLVGGLLGMGGEGGSSGSFSSASVDIVPDLRLNALIVRARQDDLDTIEQLLQVIDQKRGPAQVEAGGKTRLIPVYNTQAKEIIEVVKQVFGDRMQSSGGGGGGEPNPEEIFRMLRGGGDSEGPAGEPDKMSLGVDDRSNSIVIRASDALYEEVEALVRRLDEEGIGVPQSTRVVTVRGANPQLVKEALATLLGSQPETASASESATPNGGGNANGQDRAQQQRRSEFLRQMQRQIQRNQGGAGRGGDRGRGGGGRGGRGGQGGGGRGGGPRGG